jgi:hypothetical protein
VRGVEIDAPGNEKPRSTAWSTGVSLKLERAKRLELLRALLQEANREEPITTTNSCDAAGNAQAKSREFPIEKVAAWAEELDEIVCAWPMVGESVQHGLLAIVRAQSSRSARP